MLARMADVGHFCGLDTVHILTVFKHDNWSGFVFALIYHGHGMTFSHVDVLWNCLCSTRKYQGQIDSARPGPRCQRLHVSFSLTVHYAHALTVVQIYSLPRLYISVHPYPLYAAFKDPSKSKQCFCTLCFSCFHVEETHCPYSSAQSIYIFPIRSILFLNGGSSIGEELPLRRNSL